MRLLVGTHVLLWFLAGDPQLSRACRAAVEDSANEFLVSAGCLWEMAIKVSLGKLTLPGDYGSFIASQLQANDIDILWNHTGPCRASEQAPLPSSDPFDRLLVAQALVGNMSIVSQDVALDAYGVARIG